MGGGRWERDGGAETGGDADVQWAISEVRERWRMEEAVAPMRQLLATTTLAAVEIGGGLAGVGGGAGVEAQAAETGDVQESSVQLPAADSLEDSIAAGARRLPPHGRLQSSHHVLCAQ